MQPGQTGEFQGKFPSGLVESGSRDVCAAIWVGVEAEVGVEVDEADCGARGVWDQLQHGAVCDDGEVAVVSAAVCGDADECVAGGERGESESDAYGVRDDNA